MEYKILRDSSSYFLEKKVNELLNEGWEPIGGVMVHDDYFYQTLVRKYE